MFIEGVNNPGNKAKVDNKGRLETHSVSIAVQTDTALEGDTYNLNTGTFQLTDATETAIFYLKNDSEEKDIVIPRIFVSLGASTGGSGPIEGKITRGPIAGGIVTSGVDNPPLNFNFGSSKSLAVTSKTGSTALGVCTGDPSPIMFYFPNDAQRYTIAFEAIILPRGAELCLSITPSTSNTSMDIQAGANMHLAGEA